MYIRLLWALGGIFLLLWGGVGWWYTCLNMIIILCFGCWFWYLRVCELSWLLWLFRPGGCNVDTYFKTFLIQKFKYFLLWHLIPRTFILCEDDSISFCALEVILYFMLSYMLILKYICYSLHYIPEIWDNS